MGPLVFAWPSPLLVLLASLLENFVGISLRGPHAYPPAYFSQGPFFFVLWTFQSNTEPLRRQFFVCVSYFCGLLEPEQLSPTDEISVLGFELAPFFLGKRVLLTDFTVRKQGEC